MKYGGFQKFDGDIEPWPVRITYIGSANDMFTFSGNKCRWRAILKASGWYCRRKPRSAKAIGRPIRRIKRKIEKARRYTIKSGVREKLIQFVHQKVKEMQKEEENGYLHAQHGRDGTNPKEL